MTGPIIIGAGPAGCAAAIALAQAGAEPVLLDRDGEVRDQLCGGFLSWRTAAQLRALGVDPARLGGRPVDMLGLFAGHRTVSLRLPETSFALSRRTLDAALRRQAVAQGAQLVIDHARGLQGTTVLGGEHEWHGESLFLATGKHDLRGLARPRNSPDPALGLRIRLPATADRAALLGGRIELHLFSRGYAGIVIQEDGTTNVCLAVRKSLLAESGGKPARLLVQLANENPAFARRLGSDWADLPIESIGAVPYGWINRRAPRGVYALGDQGAVIPSLAGEGISIALASGTLAARHWLQRGAAGSHAYQRAMAARASAPIAIARLAWTLAEHPWAARLGIGLAGHFPPALRWLMQLSRIPAEPMLAPAGSAS